MKTHNVFIRTVHSPLFWTLLAVAGVIAFCAVMPCGKLPYKIAAPLAGACLIAGGILVIKFRKKLIYEVSLTWSVVNNAIRGAQRWPWYNGVGDKIVLGALPLKNKGHLDKLKKQENVDAVLSINEDFELRSLCMCSDPVTPEDWQAEGVTHGQLPIADFSPITIGDINSAIQFIDGKTRTYVHCKAGRGRSVIITACYLLFKDRALDVNGAIDRIKQTRPHIRLNASQVRAIQNYYDSIHPS